MSDKLKFHCCLVDRDCWKLHKSFGMPMRLALYQGKKRRLEFVFPFLSGEKKTREIVANARPVSREGKLGVVLSPTQRKAIGEMLHGKDAIVVGKPEVK